MKERPILFSTEMINAILDGRKTQTRRIVKPQPGKSYCTKCGEIIEICECEFDGDEKANKHTKTITVENAKNKFGVTGDILWVRESWNSIYGNYFYKADQTKFDKEHTTWRPSIHMPREACRIKLRITDIEISKVQNIGTFDLLREGMTTKLRDYAAELDLYNQFSQLWDKLNKQRGYSWESNPFVWVISFEKL